jgi:hypothetical protein
MRVIECDDCGATVSAPDDPELINALWEHHCHEHDELDRGDLEQLVAEQAYDA